MGIWRSQSAAVKTVCSESNSAHGSAAYYCLQYSLDSYNFPSAVMAALGERDLLRLGHDEGIDLRIRGTDQDTRWHRAFYDTFGQWQPLYVAFLRDVIAKFFTEHFYYQATPTFRVHLPHNLAVGEFHTDREYGHPEGEVNFWLPLTPAFETNSIWIEAARGQGNFQSVDIEPGYVVAFDAANLKHGNLKNETGQTRVSFDFRCLCLSDYRAIDAPRRSINTGLAFAPGSYYAANALEPRA